MFRSLPGRGTAVLLAMATACLVAAPVRAQAQGAALATPPVGVAASPATEAIRERVDHIRYDRQHDVRGARVVLDDLVAGFYEARQFRPVWQAPGRLDALVTGLDELVNDGLDPDDYHVESLRSYGLDVRIGTAMSPTERADLELLATDAFMLAAYHLYEGKVDPQKLSSQWNFAERPLAIDTGLRDLSQRLEAGQIRETLEAARPQHVWYQRGRERLKEYRAIAAAGGWPAVPEGPTLKPGMRDARVAVLRRRLAITRDLPRHADEPAADPAATAGGDSFGPELEAAVKSFQQRHGLGPDGAVGPATLRALNVPVAARIDQIRVNLERARWTLHEIKGEFVLVDVAGFYVSYFRDDEPVWTSKVVVGRDERETPIFRSTITYVVFNPTWTIPPGILVKDKLPELKRNPGALQRMKIRVLDGSGREVNPYSINWQQYGPSRLPPYQFVQDPGPNNALGLVKVMFPNPYLVYLHDSPAKSLYDQDQRTFSSGCIRVQKPMELAELVLNDPQWNPASMQQVVDRGETRTVNLKKPLPVLILYWTAQPLPDGQVAFRNDVYSRDAVTLAALNSDFRLPLSR
ncbi:MAG: L,D-transpeptidase family protein [Steroidobacteraceae bacterium]